MVLVKTFKEIVLVLAEPIPDEFPAATLNVPPVIFEL